MKCFECGGEMIPIRGMVRMTKKDGALLIFRGIPLSQCRQCGEQYISGEWSEKIGTMMKHEDELTPQEILSVPVIAV